MESLDPNASNQAASLGRFSRNVGSSRNSSQLSVVARAMWPMWIGETTSNSRSNQS
jgi:hypothetical protein